MTSALSPRRLWLALLLVAGLLAPSVAAAQAPEGDAGDDSEIVGGQPASPGEHPFTVALLLRGVDNRFNAQFCGGSLISPDTVLTAAHCLEGLRARDVDVLVGTNTLVQDGGGTRVGARRIRLHPGFNPDTFGNDVAIIQLGPELPDDLIPTIQPGQGGLWSPGTTATVVGWGNRNPNRSDFPRLLHEVDVPVRSDGLCRTFYGSLFISTKMFCAGVAGQDSCQGDSGGPIFVDDGVGGVVQIGVVSWGIGCAEPRRPGVYTELARYAGFVNPYLDPDTAPQRVSRVRAQRVTPTSFRLTWRAPAFDGGTRITRYRVAVPALGRDHGVAAGQTHFRLRHLPPGRHLVEVRAVNGVGPSAPRTLAVTV